MVRTQSWQLPFYSGRPLLLGLQEDAGVGAIPLRGGISVQISGVQEAPVWRLEG